VLVCDVQEEVGRTVADEINRNAGTAAFFSLDVTNEGAWAEAVADAVGRFGALTTLVNNAGAFAPSGVEAETNAGWNRLIAINQTSVWHGIKAAMPALLASGNAAIVNIASIYGIVGSPGAIAYHATKGAVRVMTKSVALEYARRGVRANTVYPGVIKTPMLGDVPEDALKVLEEGIPMGRRGIPEDIAYCSLYLCSDEARFVTGGDFVVDGGSTAL
jgi:2,5-dichloro-2,5-cyclohexadiene-1,4-diol dehydrogenase 2